MSEACFSAVGPQLNNYLAGFLEGVNVCTAVYKERLYGLWRAVMSIIRGPGWRAKAGLAAAPSSTAMVPGAVGGLARKPGLSRGPVPAAAAVIAAWFPGAPGRGSAGTRCGQGAPACAGRQPLTQHNDPSPQRRVGTGASAAPALGPLQRPLPRSGPRPEERWLPPGPQGTQALMVGRPDLRPETGTEEISDCADGETGSGKVQTEPLTV